ncbi:hypothetical protein [Ureibacillus sinduriensis]|uniref:Uncharacterized protein n=1 Tax=Ureibacillus sinduriensis BLB-1 = JCM 15800 TaxID=1384057 RepID=A0A0A3HWZ5_9BACL|nr:hypothetical protein [Ureibacillus sinduriensis]KGR76969.1 hypothetical protein CD33_04650 [Ureibacillus sinduriensis BLB-1 = JCM 15800]
MEFANYVLSFMYIFIIVSIATLLFSFLFKKKKDLIYVIYYFILLVMIHSFLALQKDFILQSFPKQTYGVLILLLLNYFVFFRRLYLVVSAMKSEGDRKKIEG